jgi:hypothetical protein
LKENVKEDKNFCRKLVDRCRDVQLLINLCALRKVEHGLILENYEQRLEDLVEQELAKAYCGVKIMCANIQNKYDQPWVLSKMLEFYIDRGEWDVSEEDTNIDEVRAPNDQANNDEFINKEPPYLEYALDESLEDHTSTRKEPKEEIYEEGY